MHEIPLYSKPEARSLGSFISISRCKCIPWFAFSLKKTREFKEANSHTQFSSILRLVLLGAGEHLDLLTIPGKCEVS